MKYEPSWKISIFCARRVKLQEKGAVKEFFLYSFIYRLHTIGQPVLLQCSVRIQSAVYQHNKEYKHSEKLISILT